MHKFYQFVLFMAISAAANGQTIISGTLLTKDSLGPIENASIHSLNNPDQIVTTTKDGFFQISVDKLPVILVFSHVNFEKKEYSVTRNNSTFYLNKKTITKGSVIIRANRYKEKIKESPLTIESMGVTAIKETPASDFYEGLGHLKGVDVTSASLGFRIINTRGFNSTSPVRSLQLIDGVDNQAPGLNFSLGNFLGSSEIDVHNSELIVGAAGAFYGPNAFNGVLSMTTKDPFKYSGLTAQLKFGERNLAQFAVRYAKTYKNKEGVEKFAWKANLFYLRAYDWEATNSNPSTDSKVGVGNWGGYDAVNRYGDENIGASTNDATSKNQIVQNPGLGIYHRQGYWEKDIVNYNTRNFKSNLAMGYRFKKDVELQYAFSFGTGTTVYQGDNRYSLNGILFFQNRLELKLKDAFIRVYSTNEDAGNTYDVVNTSFLLQKQAKKDEDWSSDYYNNWFNIYSWKVKSLPGYPQNPFAPDYFTKAQEVMNKYSDSIVKWHSQNRARADKYYDYQGNPRIYKTEDRFEPGTDRFTKAKNEITKKKSYGEDGSGFFDKSALYHAQAEKQWHLAKEYLLTTGANGRLYRPNSAGTIFKDTNGRVIKNAEFGFYTGLEKKFIKKQLKANATLRIDKNQNFDYLLSPAASLVYSKTRKHVYRMSFTSAIRNPTLQDQYLYYNVGRAILLGNLTGFDNVLSVDNVIDFLTTQKLSTLKYFNVKPVRPEKVRSVELGYKGFLFKDRLTFDASCYYSVYKDFIGYKVVVDAVIDTLFKRVSSAKIYRVAANTEDKVTTLGFSAGINYFFKKDYMFSGNYSFNELHRNGSTDPIIPAFNTPKHKFNLGISSSDLNRNIFWLENINPNWPVVKLKHFGFSVNYKWVQGYQFEGSPQFTGFVPTYDLLDAQVSKKVIKWKSTVKIGASNLLNKMQYQVYGGPQIGRMAYISFLYEPE